MASSMTDDEMLIVSARTFTVKKNNQSKEYHTLSCVFLQRFNDLEYYDVKTYFCDEKVCKSFTEPGLYEVVWGRDNHLRSIEFVEPFELP